MARAVQRAGYTAASYLGGGGSVDLADFSALKDKTTAIWPDNDAPGKQAAHKAAEAGASVVWLLDPVDGAKADAADIPEEELADFISDRLCTATVYEPERAKLGMSVRQLYELEQPETLIENLLSAQDVTVLAAKPKAGKTNLVVGMLAENFNRRTWLGEPAKELRCVYLGEETGFRFRQAAT